MDNWVKVVGTISAALSLSAIFNYPELSPIGAIGLFSSNVGEKINNYFKNKHRWVNFINWVYYEVIVGLGKLWFSVSSQIRAYL